ncbi:hypothetical protein M8C13_36250 [Crossiella sp. SN42]|uniref:hypothetical protein n=1 Tax=Crossiella sp. SN42 TaxID=2944808 RepID=UPI00207C6955|nr:hypothetical protein [Crossiella sp. SN42]MCO1581216.1 hypothetical protein [Crossiella sp. SN42]
MKFDLGTKATCRHCGHELVQAVTPDGRPLFWVHCGTRHHRCTTDRPDLTSAEPIRLEAVK